MVYGRDQADPSDEECDRRERLFEHKEFDDVRGWGQSDIYTHMHPGGDVYLMRDGYVVIVPVCELAGPTGAFAHMASVVTRYREGNAQVVWRVADHWRDVRPAYLTDGEVARREEVLRRLGLKIVGKSLEDTLGKADGWQGGVGYRLYYISAGIISVTPWQDKVGDIHLGQPGAEKQIGFEEWLDAVGPNTPPAPNPVRSNNSSKAPVKAGGR